MVNSKRMGSIEVMVASSVVVPVVPPVTRLPGDTRRSPIRPETGARSSVNSRSRLAWRTAASCAATDGLGHPLGLRALVEGLLRDGAAAHQALPALQIGFGVSEIGAGLCEVRLRLRQRGLERPAVDGEEQVALLHQLPVLEVDRVEVAGYARAHLDGIDRNEAADVLVAIGNQPLDRLGDRHLRGGGWSSLGSRLARVTAGEQQQEQRGRDP